MMRRRMSHSLARLLVTSVVALLAIAGPTPAQKEIDKDHAAKMVKGLDLFKNQVRTVLAEKCLKCHGGKTTEAGFNLSDHDRLLKGGESGPAVLPGKGKESLLTKLVAHQKEPFMPHQAKETARRPGRPHRGVDRQWGSLR